MLLTNIKQSPKRDIAKKESRRTKKLIKIKIFQDAHCAVNFKMNIKIYLSKTFQNETNPRKLPYIQNLHIYLNPRKTIKPINKYKFIGRT